MPTEPRSPLASTVDRLGLRGPLASARRWLAARGTLARVAFLVAGLGGLGGVGYLATVENPSDRSWSWILQGRLLSGDDLLAISEALDAEGIKHVIDRSKRVGVAPDREAEALAALAKRKAIPPTLSQLGREEPAPFFEGAAERERREQGRLERELEYQVEGLDADITAARVRIDRVRPRGGLHPSTFSRAYVFIRTESGRKLGHRIVRGIETFLTGAVSDLKRDSITVADQAGNRYLAADDPALKEQMQTHALEEDWRDKIAEGLRHIPNVGVQVLLETVEPPPPPPPPEQPPLEETRLNQPLAVADPEPRPSSSTPPPTSTPKTRARVLVQIPLSYYVLAFQERTPGRQPSPDDLRPMRETTERLARNAVANTIPQNELGPVTIDMIPDDLSSPRPLVLPPASEPLMSWRWLAIAASAGVGVAVFLVTALVRIATRRPASARAARPPRRAGFIADGPTGAVPGPSERVRELIRLNPEAAAGVLQRWIGQGGALE
jgi:flagellar biosynthesis/type III secretory pathway M-ring protein FliF/YscJ